MRLKIVGRITDRQHPKCLYNKLVLLPKFGKSLNIGNSDYNGDYQRKEKRVKRKGPRALVLQITIVFQRASNETAYKVV